jgi:hypothetical protein
MPTTVRDTDILFNDSTTQSTAAILGIRATVFTSSGTFTIPAGVTAVKVTVVGGGGGGGSGNTAGSPEKLGSGGGSGGIAIEWITGLTPGSTVSVTVGSGGTAVNGTSGTSGSTSSFGSYCTATGGGGGGSNLVGGSGGAGSGGTFDYTGKKGTNGFLESQCGFQTGYGGDGADLREVYPGYGGAGALAPTGASVTGASASGFGAGGGGGWGASGFALGGSGAPGFVLVEY